MDLASPHTGLNPPNARQPFLDRVDLLLDWSRIGEPVRGGDASHLGEPIPAFALRIALIKQWYGLSDQDAYLQIMDRSSFRGFVGLVGDSSAGDKRILDELDDCSWAQHPAMAEAVETVENQLNTLGYAVRSGRIQEPSLTPRTETRSDVTPSGPTALFRPGELGRMVEAVTAKAHADGVMPAAASPGVGGVLSPELSAAASAPASAARADHDEIVLGVLEWPWGQRTELTAHLNIGRDFQFSPLARELTPYTHVSRKHAELLVYGDGVWVRDLGSRNGTYVNDEEVPKGQAYLIDSDSIIRFGPLLAVSLKLGA